MNVTSRFSKSSERLIKRFGRLVCYERISPGEYNVDTGYFEDVTDNWLEYFNNLNEYPEGRPLEVKAYKTDNSYEDTKSPDLIGRDIHTFLIAGNSINFTPKPQDIIRYTYNGQEISVVVSRVKENWAGNCVAQYRVVCTSE